MRFNKKKKNTRIHTKGIDRNVFRELMHSTFDIATEETLMERIFSSWEKGNEGLPLRLEGWIIGLSAFLRGTMAEKASFCFRVYDLNNDGFITKDEMFTLLKNSLIKQPQDEDPDESVKDLVEIALRKFDVDKDGKVSGLRAIVSIFIALHINDMTFKFTNVYIFFRFPIRIFSQRLKTNHYCWRHWGNVCHPKVP